MASVPFLLAMTIPWLMLLMPAMQAQVHVAPPSAAAPKRWINNADPHQNAGHSDDYSIGFAGDYSIRIVLLRLVFSPNDQYGYTAYTPSFVAGFYRAPPSDEFLFAVYIVLSTDDGFIDFQDSGPPQVVWVANRGRPVQENATLSLTAAGGLVLRDADGSHVWSADTSGKAVARMEVDKSGNLLLLDDKNETVWQSFDHPTDCLLPGQIFAQGMMLTPSVTKTNFSANEQLHLHITVRDGGLYALAGSNPPQVYYPNPVTIPISDKPQNGSSYVVLINGGIAFSNSSSPVNPHNILIPLPHSRSQQYMRFEPDGHLRMYEWQENRRVVQPRGKWVPRDVLELDLCGYPTVCGKYGLCSNGQCSCPSETNTSLSYFKPVDRERTHLGCMPDTPISCESAQDHRLVAFSNVSYFNFADPYSALQLLVNEENCKQACLQNCSCKAALFRREGNASEGRCLLPTELFSLKTGPQDYSAYIKVQITNSSPSIPPIRPLPKGNPGQVDRPSASIIVGVIMGSVGAFIVLVLFIVLLVYQRRKGYEEIDEEEDLGELRGMPARFTFEQLKVATDQFREKLGHGGFGSVYMGQISEERVAVKCLERAGQGKKEFLAEVQTIGSIHHINLVRLVGFCAERSQRLLVYEYMSKGSLDRWIYYRSDNAPLGWNTRSSIITDIAKGLCYLHEECRQKIAHLDIKPQNILLDDNFNAKVSDFGLAKMIDRENSQVITKLRGTPGYLAPEWLTSQITEKADVYSFGVVVMEVISGRKSIDRSQPEESINLIGLLQQRARSDQLVTLIDNSSEDMQLHKEEVLRMMKLAMWCLQIDCNKRPRMSIVVEVLEGTAEVETNIVYDFVATIPFNLGNAGKMGSSAPPQVSQLSGPR
ncbi:hypothetical protein ACP4OV_031387 [Aristida adscensionis]